MKHFVSALQSKDMCDQSCAPVFPPPDVLLNISEYPLRVVAGGVVCGVYITMIQRNCPQSPGNNVLTSASLCYYLSWGSIITCCSLHSTEGDTH